MKQLIVNADDFGLTEGVNRGILSAHRHGIVTSTTLLANGAAFLTAIAAAGEAPQLGIGVHLNLSEGLPVSSATEIPTLVDAQGRLHLTPGKLRRAMLNGREAIERDIEVELRAQIAKVMQAGITPTHLDGHMHVHVLPGVSEIVIKLAHGFRIPAVRCPAEKITGLLRKVPRAPNPHPSAGSPPGSVARRRLVALAVSWGARRLRKLLAKAGLAYPDRFYGIVETGFLDTLALNQILHSLPEGTSELMCHPGYVDADLKQVGGRLQEQRQTELAAVGFPTAARVAAEQGICLITYRDLTK